jgi:hypothetical protein
VSKSTYLPFLCQLTSKLKITVFKQKLASLTLDDLIFLIALLSCTYILHLGSLALKFENNGFATEIG